MLRREALIKGLTALRTWEKRIEMGKEVVLRDQSDAAAQLPLLVELLESQLEHLLRRGSSQSKTMQGKRTTPRSGVYASRYKTRHNNLKKLNDVLRRYLDLYRPDSLECLYD